MLATELLKRRRIRSVVWFHTDHWEPWGGGVTDDASRAIAIFTKQSQASRFARKATLFYLDSPDYRLKDQSGTEPGGNSTLSVAGDVLEIKLRHDWENRRAREIIGELQEQTQVDFQLHLHHENFSANDAEWNPVHRVLKTHTNSELDQQRIRLLLRLALETARHDTGKAFEQWAFIHGMWALNGSDRTVCQLDNEIQILMEYGCWGDFTFPAGRPHCNPTIREQPYTIKPFSGIKCYDRCEAHPLVIGDGPGALNTDRFLIWNCRAGYDVCSLDYYYEAGISRLENTEHILLSWLRACPVIDDVLYIKTHAHSMAAPYYDEGRRTPLAHPAVLRIFDALESASDRAQIEVRACTVEEVIAQLRTVDCGGASEHPASAAISLAEEPIVVAAEGSQGAAPPAVNLLALNDFAVSVLSPWVEASADRQQAAGYYRDWFLQRRLFEVQDIIIADYSAQRLAAATRLFEIGCGFGELSLLLALKGFAVVGFESVIGRHEGAVHLAEAALAVGIDTSRLTFIEGIYPDALRLQMLDESEDNVLFCTNTSSTYIMQHQQHVLRSFRLFDQLIIDVARFGKSRDAIERRSLLDEIEALGFVELASVYVTDGIDLRHFHRLV